MGVTNEQWKNLADFIKMYMNVRGVTGRIQYRPFNDGDEMHIDMQFSDHHGHDSCRHFVVLRNKVDDYVKTAAVAADSIDRFANEHPKVLKASEVNVVEMQAKLGRRDDSVSVYPYMFTARQNGKTLMQAKMIEELIKNDAEAAKQYLNSLYGVKKNGIERTFAHPEEHLIEDVIFNDPATIVFWADGTKTVVKADKEDFDPEKGLAMAISKKALGNKGNYFDIFKKWIGKKTQPQHSTKWLATQRLHNALHDKKATKADLRAAMEEAITYLEKEN